MADNSRYSPLGNASPVESFLKNQDLHIPRSLFNFSSTFANNALPYAWFPVKCFDVVPNEDLTLSVASFIDLRNPTTRELLNGCKIRFEAIYNRSSDLWEGSENFFDNGRSGTLTNLTIPNLIHTGTQTVTGTYEYGYSIEAFTPMSLADYLTIPSSSILRFTDHDESNGTDTSKDVHEDLRYCFKPAVTSVTGTIKYSDTAGHVHTITPEIVKFAGRDYSKEFINALPFMAYQRNWRDFKSNKNLLQNNKKWFPNNERKFILSYSCKNACCIDYENEDLGGFPSSHYYNLVGSAPDSDITQSLFGSVTTEPNLPDTSLPEAAPAYLKAPNLCGLKFAQFQGDRFSTASPFPDLIRGEVPQVTMTIDDFLRYVNNNGSYPVSGGSYTQEKTTSVYYSADTHTFGYAEAGLPSGYVPALKVQASPSFTWQDIKALEAFTVFRTRMGLTNGDYNSMIKSQFNQDPHSHDMQGTWIGSHQQFFNFSSISQTSQTADTPLGTKAGQGSSSGSGSLGSFHVPDFGYISVYMSIIPDTQYLTGLPKMFSKKTSLDMYYPIFNNLAPQAILNKEIFCSGDEDVDNTPFAYEPRYEEYKSAQNYVGGLMALPYDIAAYDASKIMARRFESTPTLSNKFLFGVPENVDYNVFSVNNEPPFDVSVGVGVRRVFPAPYMAVNADTIQIG